MEDIFNSKVFNRQYNYYGSDLGVTYDAQVSFFKVWSPKALKVSLVLYRNGDGDNKIE